jgi:hypothetical protein
MICQFPDLKRNRQQLWGSFYSFDINLMEDGTYYLHTHLIF